MNIFHTERDWIFYEKAAAARLGYPADQCKTKNKYVFPSSIGTITYYEHLISQIQ